jgi:hypothetical protein
MRFIRKFSCGNIILCLRWDLCRDQTRKKSLGRQVVRADMTKSSWCNKSHKMQLSCMNWIRIRGYETRSRWRVLCEATKENYVRDMLCCDNKAGVCKHCKHKLQYWGHVAIPGGSRARRISLQWSIFCMITSGDHRGHLTSLATSLDRDLSCFILNSAG